MNVVVVGYGSIGQRHARILNNLAERVSVVSNRDISFPLTYSSLTQAIIQEHPDYVVISNETATHYNTFTQLVEIGFTGTVLVEKPLFHRVKEIPNHRFKNVYVGYNLRCHPILKDLFEIIKKEYVLCCHVYVGQYLPDWRPKRDYRFSYSAQNIGGGVLLDLSHELDYLQWYFKGWNSMTALGGKYSQLNIDSTDMFSLLMTMEKCPLVQVHLNYLDRIHRREITVITDDCTIKADLVKQTLEINEKTINYYIDQDHMYVRQHKTILNKAKDHLCTLEEGLKVLEMVDAAEQSTEQRKWINK